MLRITLLLCLVAWAYGSIAQDTLYLQDAVAVGLQNNYSVTIARLNQEVLVNDQEYNWLEYTPELAVQGGVNQQVQDSYLLFANGEEQDRPGARTDRLNASAGLSYRLFEGMGKRYRIQLTDLTAEEGAYALEATMEGTMAALTNAYYGLVAAHNQAAVLEANLSLSRARVALSQSHYEVGRGSKQEYLQAQVDYNTDSAQWLAQQEAIQAATVQLNILMGQSPTAPLLPTREIAIATPLAYDTLLEALKSNPQVMQQEIAAATAAVGLRQAATGLYPTLDAEASYGYNYSNADAGFVAQSRFSGVAYGLTARWSLSGALDAKRQMQSAQLQQERAAMTGQQLRLQLEGDLASVYYVYQNQRAALALEEQSVALARENVAIAFDRYSLGIANALQLREAQRNLVQAESRRLNVAFRIKEAETELLRLSGQLLQQ